jgi:hypothetical protein
VTKTMKRPTSGEITISEAVAWVGWREEGILAACEAGNFPPAVRSGDGWVISVKRLERWLGEDSTRRRNSPELTTRQHRRSAPFPGGASSRQGLLSEHDRDPPPHHPRGGQGNRHARGDLE